MPRSKDFRITAKIVEALKSGKKSQTELNRLLLHPRSTILPHLDLLIRAALVDRDNHKKYFLTKSPDEAGSFVQNLQDTQIRRSKAPWYPYIPSSNDEEDGSILIEYKDCFCPNCKEHTITRAPRNNYCRICGTAITCYVAAIILA